MTSGWLTSIGTALVDLFAAITGFYYSAKYAAIVRRLGLAPLQHEDAKRGLIVIQVDGLSHRALKDAIEKGHAPHLRRLLQHDSTMAPWRCGLPSSTPSSQAGIMYGDNSGIPAFRWYDKQRSTAVVVKQPWVVAFLQQGFSQQHPGIMTGGSSYVNLYDGGAARSLFTLSTFQPRRFFEGVQGLGFVTIFLLNPFRTLKVVFLAIREQLTDAIQRLALRLKGDPHIPFPGIHSVMRAVSNAIFREIETFAILIDIYRGVPAIYATYYGYDDTAHHFGIDSLAARQSLRDIDTSIGQIDRMRRTNLSRAYDLIILGDHGLTPSEPFRYVFRQTLGQYIAKQLGNSIFLTEQSEGEPGYVLRTRLLLDELTAIEEGLPRSAARAARRLRLLVERRLHLSEPILPEADINRQSDVVVRASGPLVHVYLNITRKQMDLSEISSAYPELIVSLLNHKGIWLVAGREQGECLIMSRDGILTIGQDQRVHVEGRDPLERLSAPWLAAEQIVRVASFRQGGDLIVLGDYDPIRDCVVCFEDQLASHGGIGGDQDLPVIVYPRRLTWWDPSRVRNSQDLYALFARLRGFPDSEEVLTESRPLEAEQV